MEKSNLYGRVYIREWAWNNMRLYRSEERTLSGESFDKTYDYILRNLREFRLDGLSVDLGSDQGYVDQAVYLKEDVLIRLKNKHTIFLCSNHKEAFESLAEKLGLPLDISPRDFTMLSIPKMH